MKNKLNEAVNIEGATYIGTGKGFDLFDIRTWAAAQSFVVEDTEENAGSAYTQSRNTFESNITDTLRLYFFTEQNTNKVYGGVITANGSVDIGNENDNIITVNGNISFENAGESNRTIRHDRPLPLYLIPGLALDNCYGPFRYQGSELKAALPELTAANSVDLDLNDFDDIQTIHSEAFKYGLHINSIIINDNIRNIVPGTLDNVDNIYVTMLEKPENWSDNWNRGKENVTHFGYGQDPEELARIEAEREAARRAEQERIARENQEEANNIISIIEHTLTNEVADCSAETEDAIYTCEEAIDSASDAVKALIPEEIIQEVNDARDAFDKFKAEEEERQRQLAAEREARKIRYKVVGKEITITGTRMGVTELDIPETIEGKPVTKIAPLAFYDNQELRRITLPNTIKEIGQSAFALCSNLDQALFVPKNCIIGKNAIYGSHAYIRYI